MSYLVEIAQLILVGVFAVAALGKLTDLQGSRQAVVDFGVPASLARPLGTLLPLAELAVAVALLPASTAWWGALGALGLLLLFVAAIIYNLARGRTPDCHCFGRLHSTPARRTALIRNALLAVAAGLVVAQGRDPTRPGALAWLMGHTTVQQLIILGMLVVEGWFLLQVVRQNGRLLLRIEALEQRLAADGAMAGSPAARPPRAQIGTAAPTFALPDLAGTPVRLEQFRGSALLLLFWNPRCRFCQQMLPDLRAWEAKPRPGAPRMLVISTGSGAENRALGLRSPILLDPGFTVGTAFGASGTPSGVLVDEQGQVASELAVGRTALRELAGAGQDAALADEVVGS